MKLFERVSDVLRANIGDLLSKAEDPEKMIKQYLEDGKTQLSQMTFAVGDAVAAEKILQKQMDGLKSDSKHWEQNAKNAIEHSRDDLAKKALEQQEKINQRIQGLIKPLADAHAQAERMKETVFRLKERIEETESNASILIARAKAAKAGEQASMAEAKMTGGSPLDRMKSMEEKILSSEAHAEALNELSTNRQKTLDDEFKDLSSESNVEDKLAALKAKMGK